MKKYAFRRLLQLIPILFAITFLSYGMMRIAGSDVVTQKMENTGQIVSEDRLNAAREQLGLDKPGTSFHIIFRYLKEKLYPNLPRAILIFTDGCARFPDEKEAFNVPVLWLICKGGNADVPWGQVIQL